MPSQETKQLLRKYTQLDSEHKTILQLVAIISRQINKKKLVDEIIKYKIFGVVNESAANSKLDKAINFLHKEDLLERATSYYQYMVIICSKEILHDVLKDAVKAPLLAEFLRHESQSNVEYREHYFSYNYNVEVELAGLRLYLYQNQVDQFKKKYDALVQFVDFRAVQYLISNIAQNISFDKEWLRSLDPYLQSKILCAQALSFFSKMQPCLHIIDFILNDQLVADLSHELLAQWYLLVGSNDKFLQHLQLSSDQYLKSHICLLS